MQSPDADMLNEMVKHIVAVADPLRIVLFGSAARGEMGPDSDLDLLVVMPDGIHHRQVAKAVYMALRGFPIPKDIVVVTEEDIRQYAQEPSLIIAPALADGMELYHAQAKSGIHSLQDPNL
ncbi:MAG: nucleotidyltransferase domain-containing protein [Magnetococcales bacterium]|nr:nucleotidyltransferase domain-containing protein [Magnetococcales bacterium]